MNGYLRIRCVENMFGHNGYKKKQNSSDEMYLEGDEGLENFEERNKM